MNFTIVSYVLFVILCSINGFGQSKNSFKIKIQNILNSEVLFLIKDYQNLKKENILSKKDQLISINIFKNNEINPIFWIKTAINKNEPFVFSYCIEENILISNNKENDIRYEKYNNKFQEYRSYLTSNIGDKTNISEEKLVEISNFYSVNIKNELNLALKYLLFSNFLTINRFHYIKPKNFFEDIILENETNLESDENLNEMFLDLVKD